MAPVVLILAGLWLSTQAVAGRLGARLLSYRQGLDVLNLSAVAGSITSGPINSAVTPITAGYRWPVPGPVTSERGMRWGRMHDGIDIAPPAGTPVVAANNGTVSRVASIAQSGGYGNHVEVTHPDGLVTTYSHLATVAARQGQAVMRGQVVGTVGNTGNSTGPHLHFEVRRGGAAINPRSVIGGNP